MTADEKQQPSDSTTPSENDEALTEASEPTLNRAERRAQAQGKKGGSSSKSYMQQGGSHGFGGSGAKGGGSRIPRTGHK